MIKHLFTSMPMFVCGICTVFVVLKWREYRTEALAWLAAFMTATTGLYTCHYLYFNHVTEVIPVSDTLYVLFNLLVYPLYFIYLSRLAVGDHRSRTTRFGLLLAPSVIVAAVIGVLYIAMDSTACNQFVDQWLYRGQWQGLHGLVLGQAIAHVVAKVLFALQIIPVLIVGHRMIKQHDKYVLENYADTYDKTLSSMHTLLIVLVVTSAASFVANMIGQQMFVDSVWMLAIPSVAFSVLLFAVAHVGLTLSKPLAVETVMESMPGQTEQPGSNEQSAQTGQPEQVHAPIDSPTPAANVDETMEAKNKIAKLKDEIIKLLHDEQLYLQHDLRISYLSERLFTNRYYIQQAINTELGCTFSDLVNRLRIEHAVRLIESTPSMPVTEVAERSGYHSLASFYRNFKLIKGCTPKDLLANKK